MKKIIAALICITVLLSMLTSCGSKNKGKDSDKKDKNEITDSVGTNGDEGAENPNENMGTAVNCEIQKLGNFSDGVAWVTYKDYSDGEVYTALIDTKGKILYKQTNVYANGVVNFVCPLTDGITYIAEPVDTAREYMYTIINSKGEIVATSESGLFDEVLAIGDGMALVYKYEGPKNEKYLYGIIDQNGEFVVDYFDLGTYHGNPYYISNVYGQAAYIGNGIFKIGIDTDEYSLARFCFVDAVNNKVKYMAIDDEASNFACYDDIIIPSPSKILSSFYFLDNILDNPENAKAYSCDEYYFDINFDVFDLPEYNYRENGWFIWNDNGKKQDHIIDIKTGEKYILDGYNQYNIRPVDTEKEYAFANIFTQDVTYFTLVNKKCEEQFEPIEGEFTEMNLANGYMVGYTFDPSETNNNYTVFDYKGNIVLENYAAGEMGLFSEEGLASVKYRYDAANYTYYYINTKGETVIDTLYE